jgi:23S rRNA (uridine2552-2'-O)-methyltransferase
MKILDVGCAPGGWSQIILEHLKPTQNNRSNLVAVDILPMDRLQNVSFIQGDMRKSSTFDEILLKNNYEKFDLILSDICPEFTGQKATDHYNLIELNRTTIEFAYKVLKRNGNLVIKTFEGSLQRKLQDDIKKFFNKINRFKPASSRSESSELYLICIGYLESEELIKEAEKIAKMNPKEHFEQEKDKAIREYHLNRLNKYFLLEDLDNQRESIKNKFKVDPEAIKLDPKEEEELRKIINEEEEKVQKELYGDGYRETNARTLAEYTLEYQRELKEYQNKLKAALDKEKINMDEVEEFFKADVEEKHLEDLVNERIRESEFLENKIIALEKQIKEEDAQDLLRPDLKENELIAKYRRWEKVLHQVEESMVKDQEINKEQEQENIKDSKINNSNFFRFTKGRGFIPRICAKYEEEFKEKKRRNS